MAWCLIKQWIRFHSVELSEAQVQLYVCPTNQLHTVPQWPQITVRITSTHRSFEWVIWI